MPAIPTVTIIVEDNGASAALSVPLSTVQLKTGPAVGGTPNQPYASSSPSAIRNQFIGGPLVESAGMVAQQGNIALCVAAPIVTKGTASAVQASTPNGSSSVITTTLDGTVGAWDQYYVVVKAAPGGGGTIGAAGIQLLISLDAGRNFSAPIALGTANSLVLGAPFSPATVGGTGVQLNFGAGTIVEGDVWRFYTKPPSTDAAGTLAALAAYQASQFAVEGVGSMHIIGDAMHGGSTTDDISAIETQLDAGTAIYQYNRAIVELRDAVPPSMWWGGTAENEATWMTALETAMSGVTAKRVAPDGGYYNMPSPYANIAGGLPSYRRPLSWTHAVRRTQIALNQRAGEVDLGPYSGIAVNAAADPADGFVYHNEGITPGLNAARIGSAMTWPKKGQGFFQCQEPLLSAPGSQIAELAIGNLIDAACDIGYAAGVEIVSSRLLVQANGTLDPFELQILQGDVQTAENEGLVQGGLASSVGVTVSATANLLTNGGKIPIAIAVTPEPFANAIVETITLNNGG